MQLLLFMFALPLALGAESAVHDESAVDALGAVGAEGAVDAVRTVGAAPPPDDRLFRLQRGECPMFWYNFNGRCYKYVATAMTWADAELHCVSQGANLVSIHSQDENNFVRTLIKNFDHAEGPTWIGLIDIPKEGHWMWSDGCPARFFIWGAGEPNNLNNEDCGNTNHGPKKQWNDNSCSAKYTSVCATRIICS